MVNLFGKDLSLSLKDSEEYNSVRLSISLLAYLEGCSVAENYCLIAAANLAAKKVILGKIPSLPALVLNKENMMLSLGDAFQQGY